MSLRHSLPSQEAPLSAHEIAVMRQSYLLSFVAGYVDVVGFVALFGLFTNHVTGNIVMIGSSLVQTSPGLVSKLLAIPVFIACVAMCRLLVLRDQRRGRHPWRWLDRVQVGFLMLFALMGWLALPIEDPDAPLAVLAGLAGVAAMSIQNAQARLINPGQVPTTVMTGNITQAVIDMVDIACHRCEQRSQASRRFRILGPAILAFIVGAVCGAHAFRLWSFLCLGLPIVLLLLVMLDKRRLVGRSSAKS